MAQGWWHHVLYDAYLSRDYQAYRDWITTPTSPTLGYLPAVTAGGKAYRAAKNLDNNWEDEDDDYADFLIKSRKKNKRPAMPLIKFYHRGILLHL